jgi:hypothetical protein
MMRALSVDFAILCIQQRFLGEDRRRSKQISSSGSSYGSRREQQQQEKHTKRLKLELRAMRISSRLC